MRGVSEKQFKEWPRNGSIIIHAASLIIMRIPMTNTISTRYRLVIQKRDS